MKKILVFFGIFAVAAVLSGCEEKVTRLPDVPLTMTFSDFGYVAEDGSAAYRTEFSEGDRIGLFAVENGTVVENIDNLCLTASLDGEELIWRPADASMLFPQEAVYYAYYPYQEDFSSPVNVEAVTAEEFFAGFISSWTLPADQSGATFRTSDLMIGVSSAESSSLDVTLSHAMGLVAIELPGKAYRFTNTDYQIPDYFLSALPVFNDFVPYSHDGCYLYIVKPGDFSLSGIAGEEWSFDGSISAGAYMLHSEGETEIIEHQLQIGDFFLADGSLLSKDAPASEVAAANVIGIVCQYNPERIAEGEREALGGVAHALVLATRVAGFLSADNLGYMRRFYTDYSIQNTDFEASYTRDEEEIGFPNIPMTSDLQELYTLADENLDGYRATHLIYTERADDFAKGYYPGFKAVYDFASEVGGPAEGVTTGWFMPSGGQYLDAIRNLCNVELDITGIVASGVANGSMAWEGQGALASAMNKAMEKVSNNNKILYSDYQNGVMIAATASDKYYRYIDIADGGWVDYICFFKYATSIVRPMLAF